MSLHATMSIDVMKIDEAALFKGKKGTYLGLTLMENRDGEKDKFGNDGFVVQDIGKDRRVKGEKGPILGNWKFKVEREPAAASGAPERAAREAEARVASDDTGMPF